MASDRVHHSLAANLKQFSGKCVVAEIKKASPSAGVIRDDFDPESIARAYIESGAKGISILTEPNHFQGSPDYLKQVRAITDLPILRKDFIVDEYQVTETAAWGADVILLIVAMIEPALMHALYDKALTFGMDVLIESHDEHELELAAQLPEAILGVNNRNLKTLKTTLEPSRNLFKLIPDGRLSIAESGMSSQGQISELGELGYDGFLIGEALLKGQFAL